MVVKLVNRDKDGGTFVLLISKEQEWLSVKGVLPRVTTVHSYFRNSYPLLFTTPSMNAHLIDAYGMYKGRYNVIPCI